MFLVPTFPLTSRLGFRLASFLAAFSMDSAAPKSSFSAISIGSSGSTQSAPWTNIPDKPRVHSPTISIGSSGSTQQINQELILADKPWKFQMELIFSSPSFENIKFHSWKLVILSVGEYYFQFRTTRRLVGLYFYFLNFICGIWNWGMANSFWNHVIQISIRQVYFQDIYSQLWIVKIFIETI